MTDELVIKRALIKAGDELYSATEGDRDEYAVSAVLAFLDHCHIHGIHLDHVEAGRLAACVREVTNR